MRLLMRVCVLAVAVGAVLVSTAPTAAASAFPSSGEIVLADAVPTEGPPTDPEECGLVDYSCRVTVSVYLWVAGFIADLIDTAITLAALPALATPAPTNGIRDAWETSRTVANSLYVLVVVASGILLMSYQTVQSSTGIKDVLPRLALGFVGSNASFLLTEIMRELGNGISVSMLDGTATVENLSATVQRILMNPAGELLTVVLIILIASLLFFFFMLAAIVRIMLWLLLTAVAPVALACHALPQTDALARTWWRAMGALLVIQVAQALVLRIMVSTFLGRESALDLGGMAENVIDVLLLIACMYVLVRIPFWAFKQVFNSRSSPLVRVAQTAGSLLVFRNLGKAFTAMKTGKQTNQMATAGPATRTGMPSPPPVPPSPAPRTWTQPELPHFTDRLRYRQDPVPGLDRQIDRGKQARLRERRRYHQPELPRPQRAPTPRWRQGPLPQWEESVPRQEPLPQARDLPPPRPRPQQDALFPHPHLPVVPVEGGPECHVCGCPLMWSERTRSSPGSPPAN